MRYVDDVHMLATQRKRYGDLLPPERFVFRLIELFEIRRQRAKLVKVPVRADQEVFVLMIDDAKIAHQVPDVGPDSEFVNLADIDCDAHGLQNGAISELTDGPSFPL